MSKCKYCCTISIISGGSIYIFWLHVSAVNKFVAPVLLLAQQKMSTAKEIMSESRASELATELCNDLLSGQDGSVEAFQYLLEKTSFLPEERNFVTFLEEYMENWGLTSYVFANGRTEIIRVMHERTKEILPEGRRIMDKYREYLTQLVGNNK